MRTKEREKCDKLREALRDIRQEVERAHSKGGSRAAYVGIDHIDHIAADALFNSAQYPVNTDLSDN